MSITIHDLHLTTRLPIWTPRYHDKYGDLGEPVVLLSKNKVYHATPVIIVEFTRAKHLQGQRFAILRSEAQKYPEQTNGTIPCLAVPLSALQYYDTPAEIRQTVQSLGW